MPFCLVLVLEPIWTVLADVLLLQFVETVVSSVQNSLQGPRNGGGGDRVALTAVLPRYQTFWASWDNIRRYRLQVCDWPQSYAEDATRYLWTFFEFAADRSPKGLAGAVVVIRSCEGLG